MVLIVPFEGKENTLSAELRKQIVEFEGSVLLVGNFAQSETYPENVTVVSTFAPDSLSTSARLGLSHASAMEEARDGAVLLMWPNSISAEDLQAVCRRFAEDPTQAVVSSRRAINVPWWSRPLKMLTSMAFSFACGLRLRDLRPAVIALPRAYLSTVADLSGEKQNYFTHLLIRLSQLKVTFVQHEVEETPARPALIAGFWYAYGSLGKYIASSLFAFLIEEIVLVLMGRWTGTWGESLSLLISVAVARIISCVVNFFINQRFVFRNRDPVWSAFLKYCIVAALVLLLHMGLMHVLVVILGINEVLALPVAETLLFTVSGVLQRIFVFKR